MTIVAVSVFVSTSDAVASGLARAEEAIRGGARLIEWRIDELVGEADAGAAVASLVRSSPAPCIVTCRRAAEGGRYRGEPGPWARLLQSLAPSDHRARYVDVECDACRRDPALRAAAAAVAGGGETSVILSSHALDRRPPDLLQRVEAMAADELGSVVKVAWTARSLRDNLEAFDLLTERRTPMIALCMGEFGLMSRVLAAKFGGLLTFAALRDGEESGPGQPTLTELREVYRADRVSASTRVYGVIGWPVRHSRGPRLHNAGFAAVGHDGVYLPLPIPPEYEHFKATVGALIDHPRLHFSGASVTRPHKRHLLRFVAERGGRTDAMAERIGAANTLAVGSAGMTACTNTDAPAAVRSLCRGMGIGPAAIAGLRVAVLGAGGVARAVVAALTNAGASVVLCSRSPAAAHALAKVFDGLTIEGGGAAEVVVGTVEAMAGDRLDVIVNCTPVGMTGGPDPTGAPLPDDFPLDDTVTVFDTVYTPPRTPLIRQAEARGSRVITGVDMFLLQAAAQFEQWTGTEPPMAVFRRTLEGGSDEGSG